MAITRDGATLYVAALGSSKVGVCDTHQLDVIRHGTNTCNGCHVLDPQANPASQSPGFFGTAGSITFDFQPQLIKTPHLRNLYQKIGMFGMAAPPFGILPGDNDPTHRAPDGAR